MPRAKGPPEPSGQEPKSITATARMTNLAKICEALGHAIEGAGHLGPPGADIVQTLSEQLIWTAKRACWVEKQGDPEWTPYAKS